jgi:hypothetical protein
MRLDTANMYVPVAWAKVDGRRRSVLLQTQRWRGLAGVSVSGEVEELQQHRLDQEEATNTPERLGVVEEHWREWNAEGDPR